jgi:hypothetical protein
MRLGTRELFGNRRVNSRILDSSGCRSIVIGCWSTQPYISLFAYENSHYSCTGTRAKAQKNSQSSLPFVPTASRGGRASRVGRRACVALRRMSTRAHAYDPYFKSREELCRRWLVAFHRGNASRPECALWRAVAASEMGMRARDTTARVVCTRRDDPGGNASPRGPC